MPHVIWPSGAASARAAAPVTASAASIAAAMRRAPVEVRPLMAKLLLGGDASEDPALAPLVELEVLEAPAPSRLAEAEVELADVVVAAEALGGAVEHDAPALHDVAVVRDPSAIWEFCSTSRKVVPL